MRKGLTGWVCAGVAALGVAASVPARAQAPGTLAVPYFQDRLTSSDQQDLTPRLAAMGGVFAAVDDPHNFLNLWRLDRNPAALTENMVRPSIEILGVRTRPRHNYVNPVTGAEYQQGYETSMFGGAVLETKKRNRTSGRIELSYRALQNKDIAGLGLNRTIEGNGPFLGVAVNQRSGRLHYGADISVYNVDESRTFTYDSQFYDSVSVARINQTPELATDRVAYHAVKEVFGLQYELSDGLRFGGTIRLEQRHQDGASSNERMQLDALDNHNLIGSSLGATYRYKDRIAFVGRYYHNSYDGEETFTFSRRQKKAVTEPPIVYIGKVADHRYREYAMNARLIYAVDPRRLKLGLAWNKGKDQRFTTAASGRGSFNDFDSTYLANTIGADSLGITAGPLVENFQRVNDYLGWTLGVQGHPSPKITVAADYSRTTANLLLQGLMYNPDRRQLSLGGEYVFTPKFALRAGWSHVTSEDKSGLIDKKSGSQISFGLGYVLQRLELQAVYLNGTVKSDDADPSQAETHERGLRAYGRLGF